VPPARQQDGSEQDEDRLQHAPMLWCIGAAINSGGRRSRFGEPQASDAGCTTNFSTQSATTWKWHSSCTTLKSQSDGETVFNNAESYKTKVTTTSTVMGKTKTSTRMLQGKWIGADCGDVKPLTPPGVRK
jgi:hypothetical protein